MSLESQRTSLIVSKFLGCQDAEPTFRLLDFYQLSQGCYCRNDRDYKVETSAQKLVSVRIATDEICALRIVY